MRFFLINCFVSLRFKSFFYILFFPCLAWTSETTGSADLQSDFWRKIAHSAPAGVLRDWQNLHRRAEAHFHHLELLANSHIFQDHLYTHFKSLEEEKRLGDVGVNTSIQKMWEALKSGSYDEIMELVNFIQENRFSKTDKILIALVLIFHNKLSGEQLFDVVEAFGLSVDDRLEMENLHLSPLSWLMKKSGGESSFLEQRQGTLAVLSHFLASTGDPEVIKKLISIGYDSSIKTSIGENILHSFSRINNLRVFARIPGKRPLENYEKSVRLLALQAPQLKEETNILRLTPFSLAYMMRFGPVIQALSGRKSSTQLANYFNPLVYLKDKSFSNFGNRLFKKTDVNFENRRVIYLDSESLMLHLISSFHFSNPEVIEAFKTVQGQLAYAESERLEILARFLYDKTDTRKRETAQQRQFFQMVFWGNRSQDRKSVNLLHLARGNLGKTLFVASTPAGDRILVSNTFLEAIRHSSLSVVQELLNLYTISDLMEVDFLFVGLDPLSLSLVIYAGLPEEHPRKKQAREIIRILAKKTDLNDSPASVISLPPLVWAILFGLLEEARFFRSQGADMITAVQNEDWEVDLIDYTRQSGFIKLGNWMEGQIEGQIVSSDKCKRHYLQ